MKKLKKLLIASLSVAMIASVGAAGIALLPDWNADVTAVAEETERKDVKAVSITRNDGVGAVAIIAFDFETRNGNGTFVNNLDEVGNYIYYNRQSCKDAFFDVHMRGKELWVGCRTGTTISEGDTITFQKGLHFPVVTNDGEAVTSYKDYLGETVVFEYTADGWVNKTEADKASEQQVNVTGIQNPTAVAGNAQLLNTDIKFTDSGNDHNYMDVQNWVEVKGYILYNGETTLPSGVSIRMLSGNFHVEGFNPAAGDTLTILEGLHMPANPVGQMGGVPSYADQVYYGYISETYTIEWTAESGWVRQAAASEPNTLNKITEVKEIEAGATMPATYEFTLNFDLRVSKNELTELEKDENYAKNIYLNDKSIYEWNQTVSAENNDGEPIPAISVSAYGTGITLVVVKSTGIVKAGENLSVKVSTDFVCTSGNTIEEEITRYYISGLGYWSTVAPYEIEKTTALTVGGVKAFEVIDNGTNGVLYVSFNEAIADGQLLWYNCHPEYRKTLPAGYAVEKADDFASSGATLNFIEHIYINGKSMADYWTQLSGSEAKSSLYQCHIITPTLLRIGSAVSNGFSGNEEITVVLKKGLVFFNGAYLDHDVTVVYTPAAGETPASTVYSVAAETIVLSSDKTELTLGETAALTAVVAPADYTEELTYISSDSSVASVSVSEDGEAIVTALKAGTAQITAKAGDVLSNEIAFTVSNPPATAVVLSSDKEQLKVNETASLTADVTPEVYDGTLVYVSSDETIASVSADGVVTAKKAGTVTITARIGELVSNEISITVVEEEKPDDSSDDSSSAGSSESDDPGTSSSSEASDGSGKTSSESGCGSVVSAGFIGSAALLGIAILLKKKKD